MRVARRFAQALLIVVTLIIGATAAAIIVTQTVWFKDWLRGFIVRQAENYLNGKLSIQRLGGNLFFGVEMENVGISMDGTQVVGVKDLGLDYNVFAMIAKGLSIDAIRLDKPVIYLKREGDTWQITKLVKKQQQEVDRQGPDKPIAIDEIGISDGSVRIDGPVGTSGVDVPKRIDHLDAKLSYKYEPVHYSIEISHVSFRGSDPALAVNALSGGIALRDDNAYVDKLSLRTAESSLSVEGAVQQYTTKPVFKLQLSSDKLSIPEIARLVPALQGIELQPQFAFKVDGPLDRLGVDMHVQSSAGAVSGQLLADVVAPGQSVKGTVSIRHLNLAPLVKNPVEKSDITADIKADIAGESFAKTNSLHGTVNVDAPRVAMAGYDAQRVKAGAKIDGRRIGLNASAAAYGATATAAGNVVLPEQTEAPTDYDVHGQLRRFDLRKLPRELKVPPAATNLNADYHVIGSLTPAAPAPGRRAPHPAAQTAANAAKAGAAAAAAGPVAVGSAVAGKPAAPSTLRMNGDLRFLDSDLAGTRVASGSRVGFTMNGQAVGYDADATVNHLDLEKVGGAFQVKALANDRYKSDINAHVTAKGAGTTPKTMNVTADGEITNSTIMGGRIPQLGFSAQVANDNAHVAARGGFAGFDPGAASGKPAMKGTVGGSVDIDATVQNFSTGVTPDTVQGTAKLNLQTSEIGGLAIDKANLDADYHDNTGVVRTLDVAGRDVNVQAKGTLALNDTGQSNLQFHADTPSLAQIGKLVDQLQLSGIAKVDGTITGNRRSLEAKGNVTGAELAYGANKAMQLSIDYDVRVPELTFANADVSASTKGTFVTVGGQNINELTAKTDYGNHQVKFDMTAQQPKRSLAAAGDVLLHPDHQEVHLQKLALQSSGVDLHVAPGAQPAIQYGGNAVTVKDLRLVTGQSQIAADGAFGRPGDQLKVTLKNFDVATVDALLIRPPQLSGTADGDATISGTTDDPRVAANLRVNQGGFRQFHYQSLTAKANYAKTGVDLDARLEQNPTTWLTAKGYLPMALFNPNVAASGTAGRIDFHVDSSPIDLGLVQGFTTSLSNVTGTLNAKIDVTGTAADPHANGGLTIQNAAFTVEPTSVKYTQLDGRIDLRPDRIHIEQIRLLDNQQKPLTITGDLAIHEKQLGGVNVAIKSDDFKVIDNKMGNVRINSNLRIAGELRYPRIEGDLGVNTGSVNLDPILANAGGGAYSTSATEYETTNEPATAATGTGAAPGGVGVNSSERAASASRTAAQPTNASGNVPPAPAASTGSAFDALTANVHLTVPDDLVIKAQSLTVGASPIGLGAMNLTLGGDMWVSKQPWDVVRLVGSVKTIRGFYDFQGRRFTILRDGTVRFDGLDQINPTLDLKAERLIQGVQANVNVRGTLDKPQIVLTSVPPLEPGDILALIVFNQPLNQLGEGQQISLAQRAESMATGAVAGQLAKSIGNALNLDEFEINMAPETGGGPQVTLGEQVGQNLYVKVEQGISNQGMTNVILEYELTKWLRFRTNVMQGSSTQQSLFQRAQGTGADLLFFFSY